MSSSIVNNINVINSLTIRSTNDTSSIVYGSTDEENSFGSLEDNLFRFNFPFLKTSASVKCNKHVESFHGCRQHVKGVYMVLLFRE